MAKDNQVLVRLNDPQFEAFKKFAEDRDYNHAEASREIIKSRLAGEGYLQNQHYDPIPDGGEIKDQLESVENQLESQSKELESTNDQLDQFAALMLLSVLYIGSETVFGLPPVVTVLGGTILIGLLSFWLMSTSLRWFNDD